MADEQEKSYRSILKATSIFGGVQIWKILLGMVGQKFIAVLIGPAGMGITGLYQSGLNLIQGITSLGLSQSAVKNVSEANASGDQARVNTVITALRRIVWFTGLLGTIAVIVLSPWLSKSSFGNYDYTIPFALLSVTLLLNQLSAGQSVVLQGLRKIRYLAKSGIYGALLGLIISVPIYYFFRIDGIVPTLILNSATTLLLTWYFSHKITIPKASLTTKQTLSEGREMVKMGIALSLNSLLVMGVTYVTRIFIGRIGGIEEVGLYVAGVAIVHTYVGLVFNAMSTDYYPRLASFNNDNQKCCECINQQSEVGVLILTPVLMLFLVAAPIMLVVLYSDKFIPVTTFMQWAILGTLFKVASWAISFVFIAKGAMKDFLVNEITVKVIDVPMNLAAYYFWGLDALGIALALNNLVYLAIVYVRARANYSFHFSDGFVRLFTFELIMLLVCFLTVILFNSTLKYIGVAVVVLLCLRYTYAELNKRIAISSLLKRFHKK